MDGIRGRRFAAQVGRFRARFAQAGSSTLSKLMPASLLEGLITQSRERWRDRIYGPLQTLKLFLDQVLSADGSCQDAVARGLSERTALGLAPCSLNNVSGNRAAFLPTSSAGGDRIEADWPRSVASTALG